MPAVEPPADLTDALANARGEVLASADSELSFATRRRVLRLLGPGTPAANATVGDGHARRIRLCVAMLRRVLPVWQAAYPDSVARWEPERVIELATARLAGWASYRLLHATANSLVTFAENAEAGPAFPVARATVCAAFVAASDEELDPDPELDDPEDPDLWDCAFWSAGAAAGGLPWVDGFDQQRYLSFWLWYLDEAVPSAYRAVPDGGGHGACHGPDAGIDVPDGPLAAAEEAVAVYRRLARTGRDRDRHWLDGALARLATKSRSASAQRQ